jgi:hypothetical protein
MGGKFFRIRESQFKLAMISCHLDDPDLEYFGGETKIQAFGLVLYPAEYPGQYFRVGVFDGYFESWTNWPEETVEVI